MTRATPTSPRRRRASLLGAVATDRARFAGHAGTIEAAHGAVRKLAVAAAAWAAAAGLLLVSAGVASAESVVHLRGLPASGTFLDENLSAACGFDVTVTYSGTFNATLFLDTSGTIVREMDVAPAATTTFSGNGRTLRQQDNAVLFADYPEGATVGAPANLKLVGLFGHVPGIGADAGQALMTGTVVGFTAEGDPIVQPDDPYLSHGNRAPFEAITAAICGALSGP